MGQHPNVGDPIRPTTMAVCMARKRVVPKYRVKRSADLADRRRGPVGRASEKRRRRVEVVDESAFEHSCLRGRVVLDESPVGEQMQNGHNAKQYESVG